jgi:hypothetical protein
MSSIVAQTPKGSYTALELICSKTKSKGIIFIGLYYITILLFLGKNKKYLFIFIPMTIISLSLIIFYISNRSFASSTINLGMNETNNFSFAAVGDWACNHNTINL